MANYLYTITIPQRGLIKNKFHFPIYKHKTRINKSSGKLETKKIKYCLTLKHLVVLSSITNMITYWININKIQVGDKIFYNIAYKKIISENPFLRLSKTTLYNILKTLEVFGLLEIRGPDYSLNRTYMRLGSQNYKLFPTKEKKLISPHSIFPTGQIQDFELNNKKLNIYKLENITFYRSMNYNDFLRTKYWEQVRKRVIFHRKVCENCGSRKKLQVHHLTYEIRGKEMWEESQKSLQLLCHGCHKLVHNIK